MNKLTFICLFISSVVFSQTDNRWKIYSDMKDTKVAISTTEGIWAITGGGAYFYIPTENSFKTLTKAEGLNSQDLTAMCVDKNKKIWIGSKEGYINIYDPETGNISRVMDIFNATRTRKQINQLIAVNDTVFVATDFGLSLINISNFSFYDSFLKFGDFAAESKVLNILKDELLYVVTEKGVAIQKPGTQNLSVPESWNTYNFNGNISAQSATKLIVFNNEVLLSTNNGVHLFDGSNWTKYLLPGENIVDMLVRGNSIFFLSTNKVFVYSNNQINTLYDNPDLIFHTILSLNEQSLYVSSSKGLIEIIGSTVKSISPEGPSANKFTNMAVDQTGNIWISTGKDETGIGLMKFDGSNWSVFNLAQYPELQSNSIYNVAANGNDVILSNWGKGVTIYKENKFTTYNASNTDLIGIVNAPSFVSVSAAQADSKGNIWIANNSTASSKQLSVLTTGNNWYHYNVSGLSSNDLGTMVIDQYDTKWFVVTSGIAGLYYHNEKSTFANLTDDTQGYVDGLITNDIYALAIDKRGQLWIGTSQGINLIADPSRPRTTLTNKTAFSVRNQTITCIAVDPLDNKWIGTKQGVFVLSPDGIQLLDYYTTKNSPLPNDDIKSIVVNPKDGIVYIGTDYGLAALSTPSVQPVESFDELFIYPNPLILDGTNTNVTINGLIKDTSIKIIDVSGKSVRTFETPGGKMALWDGRDDDGNYVSSGIYIVVAYDLEANNVATAKVAVIKK